MPWTFCSPEDVMGITPITRSELQDSWSEMVEALIRQHLGQPYLGSSEEITGERHSGDGTNILRVKKPPIISVTSLAIAGSVQPQAAYVAFPSYIELTAQTFPVGTLNVEIAYTSGKEVVDDVTRLAAVSMIVAIINYRRRFGADGSLKWGRQDTTAGEETPNLNVGLTSHLYTIMKRLLKRPRVMVR